MICECVSLLGRCTPGACLKTPKLIEPIQESKSPQYVKSWGWCRSGELITEKMWTMFCNSNNWVFRLPFDEVFTSKGVLLKELQHHLVNGTQPPVNALQVETFDGTLLRFSIIDPFTPIEIERN